MGYEFELKYNAAPDIQAAVLSDIQEPWQTIAMETTYYDTADNALSARHCTLRMRMENGSPVCTLKTPAGALGRGEWETPGADIMAAIPELCKLGAPEIVLYLTAEGVQCVCGARFTRRAATVETQGATVEIAVDEGILFGGGREIPLCEIEVELKSGDRESAIAFAEALAGRYGLTRQTKSKFRRALDLKEGV